MSVGDRFRRFCWPWSQSCQRVRFFLARVVSFFSGQEVENQRVANGVDTLTGDGENVPISLSACIHAPRCIFLLFLFNDIVRRTPSANPVA